jgi:hypothetical protein
MRQSRRLRRIAALSQAILLGSWLVGGGIGHATQTDRAPGSAPSSPGTTIEPLPGLEVSVDLALLQKGAKGAVAELTLRVTTDLNLADGVLSAKTPADLVFADGSKVKTWKVKPLSDREQTIRVEVIAPRDGVFNIAVEMEGTVGGKPIHRGVAYELRVGEDRRAPEVRHGAIEYPALQEGGA